MASKLWWQEPMRVIQYNLQVMDTPGMNAEKIAEETKATASNVVVMNVGGIYAWYQSKVKYHHINEFLPKDTDLLADLISEFHKRNIKFIARFDFSITDDTTYLSKPQWFARHKDKSPYYRGEKRMGTWSLFLNTCSTGGYRNEEVAVPVINEVLDNYDIDGIFFNAPFASACFCERCQANYIERYGKSMPDNEMEFESDWLSYCTKANISNIYKAIKAKRSEVPMILYYKPYSGNSKAFGRFDRDNIYDRFETADLLCTESQNVLSRGVNDIPETTHPIISMKAGQTEDGDTLPFGIIHSSPGMDWRHVGLPEAEYLPWMCQIPASNGIIWHSVTGYNDTITDKRIISAVTKVNKMIAKSEIDMYKAKNKSEVLLLWDGSLEAKGWADALVKCHIQFDLMHNYCMNPERLNKYKVVISPKGFMKYKHAIAIVREYVINGGKLICEELDNNEISDNLDLLGIRPELNIGEFLYASYMRFEKEGEALKEGMDTDKIPFRGHVCYCMPADGAKAILTLVPPFAPMDVVGAPPERASIPVDYTDIPLCIFNQFGKGQVLFLPYSLSMLVWDYKLYDHYSLIDNMTKYLLGGRKELETTAPSAIQITMYENGDKLLVHFVNEIGQRPLMDNIPYYGLAFSIVLPENKSVKAAASVIGEEKVEFIQDDRIVNIKIEKLDIWDMIKIELR